MNYSVTSCYIAQNITLPKKCITLDFTLLYITLGNTLNDELHWFPVTFLCTVITKLLSALMRHAQIYTIMHCIN